MSADNKVEIEPATPNALEFFYREPGKMEALWLNPTEFTKFLSCALDTDIYEENRSCLHEYASYFLSYVFIFLVKKNEHLKALAGSLKQDDKSWKFMKYYFMNNLVSHEVICSILDDENLVREIGDYEHWIEYPLLLRAKKIINSASSNTIETQELIPLPLGISSDLQEYLLAWAYEEQKLSADGIKYFKNNFSKKYELLDSIVKK